MSEREESWVGNYFNYFTEVEEHFQRARGTGLFLLSPLDWALVESWKNAGVPLTAVLRGIDEAFEKWRGRKSRTQMINSLTFCSQAVLTEAQIMAEHGNSPVPYILALVAALVVAYSLAWLLPKVGARTAGRGVAAELGGNLLYLGEPLVGEELVLGHGFDPPGFVYAADGCGAR